MPSVYIYSGFAVSTGLNAFVTAVAPSVFPSNEYPPAR